MKTLFKSLLFFYRFRKTDDAKKAIDQCNGFKLVDFQIKVEGYNNDMYFPSFTGGEGELDGGDGNGIRLDARSRLALMNRLSQRTGRATPATTPISAICSLFSHLFFYPSIIFLINSNPNCCSFWTTIDSSTFTTTVCCTTYSCSCSCSCYCTHLLFDFEKYV